MTDPNPQVNLNPHFSDYVRLELENIRDKGDFNSCHEAYGVILEEVDEFWDEVKKKRQNRDYANILKELVQIGACCQKAAESLGLVPPERLTENENDARIEQLENMLDVLLTHCEENGTWGEPTQKDGPKPYLVEFESAQIIRQYREAIEE